MRRKLNPVSAAFATGEQLRCLPERIAVLLYEGKEPRIWRVCRAAFRAVNTDGIEHV